MRSAHYNLEMFPYYALATALTQTMAPRNQQLIKLLKLHVLAKAFVFYRCYLLNWAPLRATSHVFTNESRDKRLLVSGMKEGKKDCSIACSSSTWGTS